MRYVAVFILGVGLLSGCSGARPDTSSQDSEAEISRLEARVALRPSDAGALRQLGLISLRTGRFLEAEDYLRRVFALDPNDPETLFGLGLTSEKLGKPETALRFYEKFEEVPETSPVRKKMRGRMLVVKRQQTLADVRGLAASEDTLGDARTSDRIIAVYPLSLTGGDNRYDYLGRGLSEMLTTDLANVGSITLVERIRLQSLIDEMELGENSFIDPSSRPRPGRLLGAGRLIGGTFAVTGSQLDLDVAVVTVDDATIPASEAITDDLNNILRLEKELVFALIDELGISLTPDEQRRIEEIPTQDLQAFLAFSLGVEAEDSGDLAAAGGFYREAASIDPSFAMAAVKFEDVTNEEQAEGTPEELIADVFVTEDGDRFDLESDRLIRMDDSIGRIFYPGEESREPAEETLRVLPVPPRPPGNE